MTRYLALIESDKITFRRIKPGNRPVLKVGPRIYRADESIYINDKESTDAMLIYDIDGTQPHGHARYYNPDLVRIYVDSAKLKQKGKAVSELGGLIEALGKNVIAYVIALIIGVSFIMGIL